LRFGLIRCACWSLRGERQGRYEEEEDERNACQNPGMKTESIHSTKLEDHSANTETQF